MPWSSIPAERGLRNVRASVFLRAHGPHDPTLVRLHHRRVLGGMRHAARTGRVFHLWWHPHNFAREPERCFAVLDACWPSTTACGTPMACARSPWTLPASWPQVPERRRRPESGRGARDGPGNAPGKVLVLGGPTVTTRIVVNWLRRAFGEVVLMLERPAPRRAFLARRVRRYGPLTVLGQVLYAALLVPPLRAVSRHRIAEILASYDLDPSPPPVETFHVPSVNSTEARQVIAVVDPAVVVVQGTRIVRSKTLDAIGVPIVNTHMGVTPLYRGVHGGYWALADGRPDLVGTTIFLIDKGIDTGAVLKQVMFEPDARDSIVTYPYLHLATALPVLSDVLHEVAEGRAGATRNPLGLESRLRTHPTLWGYLYRWLLRGVR